VGPPDGPICHPTSNVDDIWCIMIFYNFDGSSITPRWLPPNLWFQKNVCQRVSWFVTLFSDNVIVLRGKMRYCHGMSRFVTLQLNTVGLGSIQTMHNIQGPDNNSNKNRVPTGLIRQCSEIVPTIEKCSQNVAYVAYMSILHLYACIDPQGIAYIYCIQVISSINHG